MLQHALLLCNCLPSMDVGAAIGRLRATDRRPYEVCPQKAPFLQQISFYALSFTSMGVSMGLWNRSTNRWHFTRKA